MNLKTSVILLTKNPGPSFQETLEGIYRQNPKPTEVLVIDSGSTDGTLPLVQKYPARLIEIKPEAFGHGRTRNLGGHFARGEILIFLTQDAIPASREWLSHLVTPLQLDKQLAGVYGRQIPHDADPFETFALHFTYPLHSHRRNVTDISRFSAFHILFSNVNAAIRKDIWERFPFNEDLLMCEDQEWASRILKEGYEIHYEPKAGVYHSHHYSLSKLFQRSFDTGFSFRQTSLNGSLKPIEQAARYLWNEIRFVSRNSQKRYIPFLFLREVARVAGFFLGCVGKFLPLGLRKRLSLHRAMRSKEDKSDIPQEAPRVSCFICNQNNWELECTAKDELMKQGHEKFTFFRCHDCRMVMLHPKPPPTDFFLLYPEDYPAYSTTQKRRMFSNFVISRVNRKRSRRVLRYKKWGRLLDVGCATGDFLKEMNQGKEWVCFGIEPNPAVAKETATRLGIPVSASSIEEAGSDGVSFDVVTAWDVLEHVREPRLALRKIQQWLAPDGLFVASMPNIKSFEYRLFGPFWFHLDPPRHFWHFTIQTLDRLLKEEGFQMVRYETSLGSSCEAFLQSWKYLLRKKKILNGKFFLFSGVPLLVLIFPVLCLFSFLRKGSISFVWARKGG